MAISRAAAKGKAGLAEALKAAAETTPCPRLREWLRRMAADPGARLPPKKPT